MSTFHVFGYGSLMWRPGFPYLAAEPGVVHGHHRRLCVYSWHHRGTPERPGLVLGLDRGGACRGVVFRVDPAERETVTQYLRAREQVTAVYEERVVKVRTAAGGLVEALTYVVDRGHAQYAGLLDLEVQLALVSRARGVSGDNVEYVTATAAHLRELGVNDPVLDRLARRLVPPAAAAS